MEMDAVNTPETREFYNTVWNELDAAAFPSPFTGENTTPSSRRSGYVTAMAARLLNNGLSLAIRLWKMPSCGNSSRTNSRPGWGWQTEAGLKRH
jgi:hypothetical protein